METTLDSDLNPDPEEQSKADARNDAWEKHAKALFKKVNAGEMTAENCAHELFDLEIKLEEDDGIVSSYTPRQRLFSLLQYMGYFVFSDKLKPLLAKAGIATS
jgi:hypothetical protein